MFYKVSESGYKQPADGIRFKTLVHGEKTHMAEFRLARGAVLPVHSHPHEQTGYLVSGRIVLVVGGERHEFGPGDAWNVAGDVEHSAEVLEDAVVVEVFSPVREDYL
jgi:quercetin dioxygenase-like cupin family protein